MVCPVCNEQSNFRIDKNKSFAFLIIVPFWSTDYFVTCSTCMNIFEISKGMKRQFLEYLIEVGNSDRSHKGGKIPILKEYLDDDKIML